MYNYSTDMYDVAGTYETDEERKKRLEEEAAAAKPVTQTIKTNPVTGEQEVTIKGSPRDLSAANPRTPTVTGPAVPDQTFSRMQQVESNNRDYDAQGRPITSSAGAMFRNQVMPSTAANPGYGIRPAASQTPEEYNRVGQEYYQALLKQFGGDETKAVAAYNAGPGRVQRNIQANQGQLNAGQLPQETQGYLQKVLGPVLNAVVPSAQAATPPQPVPQPVAPDRTITSPGAVQNRDAYRSAPAVPVNPAQAPADYNAQTMGPSTGFQTPQDWADRFMTAQTDPQKLAMFMADPNIPKQYQMEAAATMHNQLNNAKLEEEKKQKLIDAFQKGDLRDVDRDLKKPGAEGSWMRYLFFGLLGSDAAAAERKKLFPEMDSTVVDFTTADGKKAYMRVASDGTPLRGGTEDGRQLTEKELIQYMGQGSLSKLKPEVSMQDVEKGGMKGRVVTTYDSRNRPTTQVESGGKYYPYDASWKPVSIGVAGAKAEATKAVELRYAGPIAYTKAGADFAGEFNAKFGTNIGYQSQQPGAPLVDLNTGQPVVPNANGTISVTQGGPGGGGATVGGKTPADIQGEFEANKKIREQQAKNVNEAKKIAPFINDIKKLVDQSTGSGIGSMVDEVGNWVGYSTEGAKAIAAIKPLANKILMGVERFEGPQSNIDVQSYKEAAGQLADPKVPAAQKQAAFNTIIDIMKRNAPDLDWSQYETGEEDNSPAAKARRELEKRKK